MNVSYFVAHILKVNNPTPVSLWPTGKSKQLL